MNILWVPNFTPFPPDNGGKLLTFNRMKQVAKKHKIYMIVESESFDEKQKKMADEICTKYIVVPPVEKNKVQKVISVIVKCRNVEKYRNPTVTKKIKKMISDYKIDLINFDLPMPAVNILSIANDLPDIPVIINQQNVEFNNCKSKIHSKGVSLPLKIYSLLESKKLYRWEKKLYKNKFIKAVSHVSIDDKKLFEDSFKEIPPISEVMPIGTNEPVNIDHTNNANVKHIVFPASFDYAPNVHGAVWFVENVFPLIKKEYNDVDLYLVGRDPKPEVQQYNGKNVIVTGTVEKIEPYFALADLFVVPIFFGGGVKTKLIEMGCWKRPVVSTTFGAKGTIYNTDDIVLCDEASMFAQKCVDILITPHKYDSNCEKMYNKTKENYLWDAIGKQYVQFLENVINSNKEH